MSLECTNKECSQKLNISNSAQNFANPALSVKISVERELIKEKHKILEVGSGNLRNMFFLMRSLHEIQLYTYDLQNTIKRFQSQYKKYTEMGGKIIKSNFENEKYDIILCTFVLETICPEKKRIFILKSIQNNLKKKGVFIGSFRGYPGVIGTRYKKCPVENGFISSLNTFIKPYSITEVQTLLQSCGFKKTINLQNYRTNTPKNIHIIALLEEQDGKKMD